MEEIESDSANRQSKIVKRGPAAIGGRSAPSLSTRDDAPLAVLKRGLEKRQSAADKVINMAEEALAATPALPQDDGEVKYVLDMSDSLRSAIAEGRVKFDTAHGDPVAQIRRADGTLGEKIHVKEELIEKGVDPAELAVAMQLKSIQDKLEEITAALEEIGDGVREVGKGLRNDRLGLYLSGRSLYLEASSVSDPSLSSLLKAQSLRALSDASFQMELQLREDVAYLVEGGYSSAKGKRKQLIDERVDAINESFEAIHLSNVLRMAIYEESGELDAMLSVMEGYSGFLKSTVVPNAGKMAELDSADNLLVGSRWEKRVEMISGVSEARAALAEGRQMLLEGPNDTDGDDTYEG